jgi:hypothetical protein
VNKILKIIKGNVEVYNVETMNKIRTVYSGGDASTTEWYDISNESVKVQLQSGKVKIFNRNGNLIRTI